MATPGLGGNTNMAVGQMEITPAAQQIPFPTNQATVPPTPWTGVGVNAGLQVTFTGMEGAVRRIIATDDIYIGPSVNVTVANAAGANNNPGSGNPLTGGYWIPANTPTVIFERGPIWFIGAGGSGHSSSSSAGGGPTLGVVYWAEEYT